MKGRPGKARPHLVPLTDNMLEILHSLPRFKHGDYLFSSTLGAKSIWISSTVKGVLDAHMRRTFVHWRGDVETTWSAVSPCHGGRTAIFGAP